MYNQFVPPMYGVPGFIPPPELLHKLVATNLPVNVAEEELHSLFQPYECCRISIRRYFSEKLLFEFFSIEMKLSARLPLSFILRALKMLFAHAQNFFSE